MGDKRIEMGKRMIRGVFREVKSGEKKGKMFRSGREGDTDLLLGLTSWRISRGWATKTFLDDVKN